ncbi:DMT family transporter [Ramlibacter tataouinensis]|uniref:Membrane protein n=1 Tax=Ramlibacter tataouinensis TaxID=94132 RepID=A0A127JZY1_9BURK|nr:DMT family transporter [Ramlibacter tataouinensis]AMO25520.1 membrane protein [Ramlibacter tataouinensis]
MHGVQRRRSWVVDFILLGAIWGSSFLFTRLGAVEFGAVPTAAVRVAIASAFLVPLLCLRGQAGVLRANWKKVFWIGVFNSGIPFICFAFALLSITTGLSAILNATVPLFGAVIAWMWLGDRLSAPRALGLAIGFAGVAALAWDKASFKPDASGYAPGWAVLACLLATLCYGFSASAAKRYLGGLPALATATGSQLGATLLLVPLAWWFWPQQAPSLQAWLSLAVVGVMCTGVAYILYFRLIEQAGPSRALAVTFVVPVFAVIYGVAFLGESVTSWMMICGAVIVCGTALSTGLLKWGRR